MSESAEALKPEHLEIQFQELEQQRLAAKQGMWVFLATEVLFFGALFAGYAVLRFTYPADFKIASHEMSIAYGSVNTFILLISSLTMGRAIRAAQQGRKSRLVLFLLTTVFLGCIFLTIKGFEYAYDIRHHSVPGATMEIEGHPKAPPMHLFMFLYWMMTAFHAVHLFIGIALVSYVALKAAIGTYSKEYHNPVEIVGLYWHFVDIVWLFVYAALYLPGAGVK